MGSFYEKKCFGFIEKDNCFVLSKMDCENCSFCKITETPKLDRMKILAQIKAYSSIKSSIEKGEN